MLLHFLSGKIVYDAANYARRAQTERTLKKEKVEDATR